MKYLYARCTVRISDIFKRTNRQMQADQGEGGRQGGVAGTETGEGILGNRARA